jgi:putative DNA methylase
VVHSNDHLTAIRRRGRAPSTTSKAEELVASAHRHGSKEAAEKFFLDGMSKAMHSLAERSHKAFPMTIFYAFKQAETEDETGTASTGWETFLEAVLSSGLSVVGTWPMRTERDSGVKTGTNVLASSIVIVCRPRSASAETISRRAFLRELNQVLPQALDEMTKGAGDERSPVAPVDLSQAIIGPGMAVFSKYVAVLEADGNPMSVRTALQLINRFIAEDDFDSDTQFCLHWFEQNQWKDGKFGVADTLARAKGTSVDGVKQSGVLNAAGGVVRLLKWSDYPIDWESSDSQRLPVWKVLHQLIRVFKSNGESGAGAVLAIAQTKAEAVRQLGYRLYTLCERAGWAEDARGYNELITSWSAIEAAAAKVPDPRQAELFDA